MYDSHPEGRKIGLQEPLPHSRRRVSKVTLRVHNHRHACIYSQHAVT